MGLLRVIGKMEARYPGFWWAAGSDVCLSAQYTFMYVSVHLGIHVGVPRTSLGRPLFVETGFATTHARLVALNSRGSLSLPWLPLSRRCGDSGCGPY